MLEKFVEFLTTRITVKIATYDWRLVYWIQQYRYNGHIHVLEKFVEFLTTRITLDGLHKLRRVIDRVNFQDAGSGGINIFPAVIVYWTDSISVKKPRLIYFSIFLCFLFRWRYIPVPEGLPSGNCDVINDVESTYITSLRTCREKGEAGRSRPPDRVLHSKVSLCYLTEKITVKT